MDRKQTENAGNATATPPTRGASYAQIAPTKKQEQLELDLIGTLHGRLIRHTCPTPHTHHNPMED